MGKIIDIFDAAPPLAPGEPGALSRGGADTIFKQSFYDESFVDPTGKRFTTYTFGSINNSYDPVIYTGSETLGQKKDPFKGSNYILGFIPLDTNATGQIVENIAGHIYFFGFKMMSGMKVGTASTEYRESGDDSFKHKVPATSSFEVVKLSKAMWQDTNFLYRWAMLNVQLKGQTVNLQTYADYRCNVLVGFRDKSLKVKKFAKIFDAWVSDFEVGDMDSMSDDILLESVELSHEGFQFGTIPDGGTFRDFVPLPLAN